MVPPLWLVMLRICVSGIQTTGLSKQDISGSKAFAWLMRLRKVNGLVICAGVLPGKMLLPYDYSALSCWIRCVKEGLGRVEMQAGALLPPEGGAGVGLPQMPQHLLTVCCIVTRHHLVLSSYLNISRPAVVARDCLLKGLSAAPSQAMILCSPAT